MIEITSHQIPISDSLDQLEVIVSKLGQGSSTQAEDILRRLDEINLRLDELHHQGISLSGEEAQLDFISNQIKKQSRLFLRDIGGIQRLKELRQEYHVEAKSWWWFLDDYQNQQTRASRKRTLIWGGIIIVVLAIFIVAYQKFLAPSPVTQAEMTYESEVESFLSTGDPTKALNSANQGLQISPSDSTLIILKGIAEQRLGQDNDASQTFSQAQNLLGSQENFLLSRAVSYIRIGDFQSALNDSQQVIQLDPKSAEAYYYEASAYQNLNQGLSAYQAYDTASQLANSQGNVELVATIRIQMALLLQSMNYPGTTPQTTTTP